MPASAVEEEINVLRNQAAQRFGGNAQQTAQLPRELFEAEATRRVQVGLLFSEVIKSNELKLMKNALSNDCRYCISLRAASRSCGILQ